MKFFSNHKVAIFFVMAFVIRLISLNQSLWLDEATTAIAVQTHSFWNIVTQFSPSDFHPPLYYLFMKIWTGIFGYSEVALRVPSVLFSLGAGWFVYKIGKIISGSRIGVRDDKNVGFWSASFFLLNPLIIYYSQEARMYSMATFFIAASFYYFVKYLRSNAKRLTSNFWIMNMFFILSFYTFYASSFYIAAVWIYLLMSKRYKLIMFSVVSFILPLLLISPLLYLQLLNSRVALEQVTNWASILGNVSVKNLALIPIKFTSGRISFEPKMIYYMLAGGWMIALFGMIGMSSIAAINKVRMLLFFLTIPLLLGLFFSFFSPLLQYFRFQYLIVFLSMLLALGMGSIPFFSTASPRGAQAIVSKKVSSPMVVNVIGMLVLMVFISWSLLYLLNPQFHREDWKSLAQELHKEEASVYMILSSSDSLKYYAPEVEVQDLRSLTNQEKKILIIPYTSDIHGVDYQTVLQETHILRRTQSFRQLTYEYWQVLEPAENL
ncbi:hypothetical protein COV49_02645 [Candidatus Falkowbacteria bacterium CG11_big_fil_rev_8_21_14_0_20_39_10]|uniref:Glycosyltransferase RgtA/B/C/D-like domain-containing protein n=1 Tax=Candidatus Falkowbacteria bacterium CG11_big_fil_rev_8_21_14_0_20_39_10 TaxID=1974570 RepID=A0A2M6K920_9BACT|nr:MAG: hypothetical protein COV49_02645 [Candidatus Falkowbacteria bacterium CG11_big_fil_rev_8_21_14_0_20_39_10]